MKVHLLYPSQEYDKSLAPYNRDELLFDLELQVIIDKILQNKELEESFKDILTSSLTTPDEIHYRQEIVKDISNHQELFTKLLEQTFEIQEQQKKLFFLSTIDRAGPILYSSQRFCQYGLEQILSIIKKLNRIHPEIKSKGLNNFIGNLNKLFTHEYCEELKYHLDFARFDKQVVINVTLGDQLLFPKLIISDEVPIANPFKNLFRRLTQTAPSFPIPERSESIFRTLGQMNDTAKHDLANLWLQVSQTFQYFFEQLQVQLNFYLSIENLKCHLSENEFPFCFPSILPLGINDNQFINHYDLALAIKDQKLPVANSLKTSNQPYLIITGANQGGKTTFLRARGQLQLLTQSGSIVAAESATIMLCDGLFTHFKRQEDQTNSSGKLDEELKRISQIIPYLKANSMVLMNESFTSTNELEGSGLIKQITDAFEQCEINYINVTHLYSYAKLLHDESNKQRLFLRAERDDTTQRSFKLIPNPPLDTGFGIDIYERKFGGKD
ncbi:hypothetical protein L0B53_13945 [Vibrio sp. SS-MA-C1-2]|uniref:MutS-related protein n=1 Tax=Vibrio sp. SS-MA-C1-2 TaxID=2908646 RepID=UPI001F21275F|nr:hypothetical protein [Vibrio sp. SS-MA-C1-2]UJF18115.1 hypothetical protein L0B53_13945 [Vibrio sp. SS-MA-C1-2]